MPVPASILPCAGCHGRDGRGRPEGGVVPPDITWSTLTKPYGARERGGRWRPPYDAPALVAAVTQGRDPTGRRLDDAMPRYRFAQRDVADLIAYLRVLEEERDPGVEADSLRVGVLLPPAPEEARPLRAALEARVAELNRGGGLYGRQLELRFGEPAGPGDGQVEALRRLLDGDQVFALLASVLSGVEERAGRLLDERGVPLIGALTPLPELATRVDGSVFTVSAGLSDQARALVRYARRHLGGVAGAAELLHGTHPALEPVVEAIVDQARRLGLPPLPLRRVGPGGAAAALADAAAREVPALYLLGVPGWVEGWPRGNAAWLPSLLAPADLAGPELFSLPAELRERVVLTVPGLPSDAGREPWARYQAWSREHRLDRGRLGLQLDALAAVELLRIGLERAGRGVDRQKLVAAVGALDGFATGWTPAVSFRGGRRVGSTGSHLMTLDPTRAALRDSGLWIDPAKAPRAE